MTKRLFYFAAVLIVTFSSCNNKDKDDIGDYLNFFSENDDKKFGEQLKQEIESDPVNYPILDKAANPEAYSYIEGMLNDILVSEYIAHKDDFEWEVFIIDSDVKNAFASPGGKLYFYVGIIDYLDNASHLAGVMAHEIAHADRRHSTQQMTKAYGVDILFSMILGDDAKMLEQVAVDLAKGAASLKFSRTDEYEADEYAVKYLATSAKNYHPKGIAGFFEKLKADGHSNTSFEFLSTHPTDDNRIGEIDKVWKELGEPNGELFESEYEKFKQLLR